MKKEYSELKEEISACRDCQELFGFEPRPVFSGNENSKILQISQAPSLKVHESGKCFTDASGKKLREKWYQISDEDFYNEDNFYISAIGHCYPGKSKNGGDRKPPKDCADKWLRQEIALVDCKIIILIGRPASQYFFPKQDFSELIFNNQEIDGKLTIVLPHPSPLNRKWFKDHPDFDKKRLLEIREMVHGVLFK